VTARPRSLRSAKLSSAIRIGVPRKAPAMPQISAQKKKAKSTAKGETESTLPVIRGAREEPTTNWITFIPRNTAIAICHWPN